MKDADIRQLNVVDKLNVDIQLKSSSELYSNSEDRQHVARNEEGNSNEKFRLKDHERPLDSELANETTKTKATREKLEN